MPARSFQLERILDPRKLSLSALHPLDQIGGHVGAGHPLDFVAYACESRRAKKDTT